MAIQESHCFRKTFLALRFERGEHDSMYLSAVQSISAVLIVIRYEQAELLKMAMVGALCNS
jgi:hypothetical protein